VGALHVSQLLVPGQAGGKFPQPGIPPVLRTYPECWLCARDPETSPPQMSLFLTQGRWAGREQMPSALAAGANACPAAGRPVLPARGDILLAVDSQSGRKGRAGPMVGSRQGREAQAL
jgi:hypothetical protein